MEYCRISCLNDDKLLQLAMENYTHRQSVFKNELEEVTRYIETLDNNHISKVVIGGTCPLVSWPSPPYLGLAF